MNWQGKRVLVTGAGGFIGSHLTEKLVREGAKVKALVHYNALGSWGWLDRSQIRDDIEVIAGDITDQDCVRQAVKNTEVVFHLAALIAIPYSYQAPASYVRTNVNGTLNMLQAAREHGVERMIHTSTSEVYGTALQVPINEKHPLQGQSPYSASKIGADKMAEAFSCSFDVPVVTVRPFNTFGPRQSARAVIPTIISQCLTGDTVRLGSLSPTRDMNYVANTVDGFLAAATAPAAIGRTVSFGSGREISIGDLAQLIAGLIGKPIRIESEETRIRPNKSEVERLLADNTLAKNLLNWTPQVSLEEGLQRTITWMKDHLERYRPGVYVV
ncbi:NAD-dependent dehydratase [Syntrophotalea acetylenivorans]|uniref:NAD-dependent dehydratase n=1 Tax=Syntrophotalea acetylenivorans TaxID=1842532 RepID=A0A1L3GN37_9BACT|nr:SDR family NAD(P)-dependent oxidoreductase [Syntrophotalea acetylenivorans]APG27356.1 NAD-dependent dehydratase [Syntrophotalea acetylenivorans]